MTRDRAIQEDPAARRKLLAALDGLPDIVEATSYGDPAFKVGKKFLCRIRDCDILVVVCPLEEKEMLMAAAPGIYFETDHYRGWPARHGWRRRRSVSPNNSWRKTGNSQGMSSGCLPGRLL